MPCGALRPGELAVALVEGWRGEICHVAITDADGQVPRYKVVDPSFHNWTALALAHAAGTQISDFPLCNKSFNLSYAGTTCDARRASMLDLIRDRLQQGMRTMRVPAGARAELPGAVPRPPVARCRRAAPTAAGRAPTRAPSALLVRGPDGRTALDLGACLFCPEEAAACPEGAIGYTRDHRLATTHARGPGVADGRGRAGPRAGRAKPPALRPLAPAAVGGGGAATAARPS